MGEPVSAVPTLPLSLLDANSRISTPLAPLADLLSDSNMTAAPRTVPPASLRARN